MDDCSVCRQGLHCSAAAAAGSPASASSRPVIIALMWEDSALKAVVVSHSKQRG